jgi:NitT/TauT family transport system substrate-binding protein
VRTGFLERHPARVEALLRAQVAANALVNADPAEAQRLVNAGIAKVTGTAIDEAVLTAAWRRLAFTNDPIADSLRTSAANARRLGFLHDDNLDGIHDLTLLTKVLAAQGATKVDT